MKAYGILLLSGLALSACLDNAAIANNSVAVGDDGSQNVDENLGQIVNGDLGNGFEDINIDPNDIQGSLGQNILDLMLAMGICNFNLNSLQGLGLGNEIQLLLQLQQLQQLQALGIINSFAVDQLIQQEILSQTFNLGIIKRSIDASVKLATRGKKRPAILKRQCVNNDQQLGDVNEGVGQDQADQVDEVDQINQDQANEDQANLDQANGGELNADELAQLEQENPEQLAQLEEANPEGIEVE
ncbi:hypothetical protein O1611_g115 [Lasiodiplodia mahajangana]|uniref:Uncharacterized protein n=1 Tax=Lasiodiplodia mahajangana TaxID=1108764 RepID=A0ACC2K142_9PEZI|nr:hypothetical protein O1611_g115 [Lasiodiplodia mahajangana]